MQCNIFNKNVHIFIKRFDIKMTISYSSSKFVDEWGNFT